MGFLSNMMTHQRALDDNTAGTLLSYLRAMGGLWDTATGVKVTPEGSLATSAVFACTRVLAEGVASLPLIVYRRRKDGGKERAQEHHLYPVLHNVANPEMTSFDWRETSMAHLCLWGNAYSEIEETKGGKIAALWPLRPDKVLVRRNDARKIEYVLDMPNKTPVVLPAERVLHLRGLGTSGLMGLSPIQLARQAIGLSIAAEEFGARFFGNNATPGIILKHPGKLGDDAYKRLKKDWREQHEGLSNAQRTAIIEEGMTVEKIGIPPDDAQFLECVVPETWITMGDGSYKLASEVLVGDFVRGWDGKLVKARVAAIGAPPVKELVRIVTARGRELSATFDHPVLAKQTLRTLGGRPDKSEPEWITMGELEVGGYVRVGLADSYRMEVRDDRAWLLGLLTGDGYIRKGGCALSSDSAEVISAARSVLHGMGGDLKKSESRPYDYDIITGGSGRGGSEIRDWLNRSGMVGQHADTKRVPDSIMRGGYGAWAGFLSGYLDSDGSINDPNGKAQPKLYWSSINRDLLKDCQHLLAMMGINSAIYLMADSVVKEILGYVVEAKPQWGLYVTGRIELIKLAGILKPINPVKLARLVACQSLEVSGYREHNWLYDRVVKVERLGPGETIGIEIEGVHTFITNGIVTHNTRKFQVTEVARWFRVPPHMIADLDRATFSNIEQQSLDFVVNTLTPWLVRIEQTMFMRLLTPSEQKQVFAEFLVDGLLRGDIATRYQAYATGRQWGWLSVDEIRARENMNPLPDGQGAEYLTPLNMQALGDDLTAEGAKEEV